MIEDFYHYAPTKILFGRSMLTRFYDELAGYQNILVLYGRKFVQASGLLDGVVRQLESRGFHPILCGGIEENPDIETCRKIALTAVREDVDFLLAVGGGSVIDAAKCTALIHADPDKGWDIVVGREPPPERILPLGCVLTVPGAGSEVNKSFVVSNRKVREKRAFYHHALFPKFSVLDPSLTFSLPRKQTAYGIVDTLFHVLEQYVENDRDTPLQSRQAEAIVATLTKIAPTVMAEPENYQARATIMWCAVQAQDGTISRGVRTDWATHELGHHLTAYADIPHAQTLALVFKPLYLATLERKKRQLAALARNVWDAPASLSLEHKALWSIDSIERFCDLLGVTTDITDCDNLDLEGFRRHVRDYYADREPHHFSKETLEAFLRRIAS